MKQHALLSCSSSDLFLSAEDRYSVWCIKVAERPELLDVYGNNDDEAAIVSHHDGNHSSDSSDGEICRDEKHEEKTTSGEQVMALTDGCDVAKWRQKQFVPVTSEMEAALGVGSGCPLLRRESQLPLAVPLFSDKDSKWKSLKARLLEEPLVTPTYHNSQNTSMVVLERMDPMVLDYERDLKHLYPSHTGRAMRDSPPLFEANSIPALIHGCTTNWPAMTSMRWNSLMERFGQDHHLEWRFSDTHGVGMTLDAYRKYCSSIEGLTDDSPLAIYDSQFHRPDDPRNGLVNEFSVPTCFRYDLFASLPEEVVDKETDGELVGVRPPYQWILMGPERSGTGLHVDPIGTHAWVALIEGCKRWVLFPPDTPAAAIAYFENDPNQSTLQSVVWFEEWWCGQKILEWNRNARETNPEQTTTVIRYVEFLQKPGETIYVPAGWPHLVLNIEASVAVTQNYATEYPTFRQFWNAVETQGSSIQREMLYESLIQERPELVNSLAVSPQQQGQMSWSDNKDENINAREWKEEKCDEFGDS